MLEESPELSTRQLNLRVFAQGQIKSRHREEKMGKRIKGIASGLYQKTEIESRTLSPDQESSFRILEQEQILFRNQRVKGTGKDTKMVRQL